MSVTTEGAFQAQIKNVEIVDPRFQDMPPESFELKFDLVLNNGESGETYLEVSSRMGKGNMSDRSQMQITLDTLEKIGWTAGLDFSKLSTLNGKVINVTVKKSGNGKYTNIYIGGGFVDKPIAASEAARRVALMTGQAQQVFGGQPQGFQQVQTQPFVQPQGFAQPPQQQAQQVFQPQTQFMPQNQQAVDPFAAGRMAPAQKFQR